MDFLVSDGTLRCERSGILPSILENHGKVVFSGIA